MKSSATLKIAEEQLKLLEDQRDSLNRSIDILKAQVKVEKIKLCKGTLRYVGDAHHGDHYFYQCDKCDNMKVFCMVPKNLKCKKHP